VTFPADFWTTAKWHDGSPMTAGDFVMSMILTFDRAKPESTIYDEAYVPSYDSFVSVFKGVKLTSVDPLVIETYQDGYALDAELMATSWWPNYGFGEMPWQTVAMGYQAESAKELTFSVDKADALKTENEKIEWMSYIAGPSLDILKKYADQDAADGFIPYAPTMSAYVTADEAKTRYANTLAWFGEHGHFWIGTGPFFLDKVFPVEMTLTLTRNPDYPFDSNKWGGFGTPMIASVEVDGAGQVQIGSEATFDVFATFNGEPYPADQIDAVKWLLFDSTGALVLTGEGVAADGKYTITLTADQTSKLGAGANKLEVAVTSKAVSIPAFATFEFVTAK
jgi:peptide/nickel transport system substrate-binding protein